MANDFAAMEAVAAAVAVGAIGLAFALRVLHVPLPRPPEPGRWFRALGNGVPVLGGAAILLVVAALIGGASRGVPFDEGLIVGTVAAAALLALASPPDPETGPAGGRVRGGADSGAGIGAAGLAILSVLVVLLAIGPDPAGLFGVAVGPVLLLLRGEPASPFDLRIRFAGLAAILSAATAFVPRTVLLRTIVPDALLLPLLLAALATLAAAVGLVVDRIEGPYALGVPAAAIAGVVVPAVAVAVWIPRSAVVLLAIAAGWLGAAGAMYLPRWAVFERAEAAEVVRAGVALGVIGSAARGLRAVGLTVLTFAAAVLVADQAIRSITPEGAFGVALAGVTAGTAAAILGTVRVGTGPGGGPRRVPEMLDVVAAGWTGLTVVFVAPVVVPFLSGVPSELLGAALGLGNPATLGGIVLGAITPFLLASARVRSGATGTVGLRGILALVPAAVVAVGGVLLGPAALIGVVLGAALTGIMLGVFWASAREAAASLTAGGAVGAPETEALSAAIDGASGWRVAAAVVTVATGAMAVAAITAVGTSALGF